MKLPSRTEEKAITAIEKSDQIRRALGFVFPDSYEQWVRMGMAVKSELGDDGFDMWDEWSDQSDAYKKSATRDKWRSIKCQGGVTIGTLYFEAKKNGFIFDRNAPRRHVTLEHLAAQEERGRAAEAEKVAKHAKAAKRARLVWDTAAQARDDHPYLTRKKIHPGIHLRELSADQLCELLGYRPKSGGEVLTGRVLIAPVILKTAVGSMCDASRVARFGGRAS